MQIRKIEDARIQNKKINIKKKKYNIRDVKWNFQNNGILINGEPFENFLSREDREIFSSLPPIRKRAVMTKIRSMIQKEPFFREKEERYPHPGDETIAGNLRERENETKRPLLNGRESSYLRYAEQIAYQYEKQRQHGNYDIKEKNKKAIESNPGTSGKEIYHDNKNDEQKTSTVIFAVPGPRLSQGNSIVNRNEFRNLSSFYRGNILARSAQKEMVRKIRVKTRKQGLEKHSERTIENSFRNPNYNNAGITEDIREEVLKEKSNLKGQPKIPIYLVKNISGATMQSSKNGESDATGSTISEEKYKKAKNIIEKEKKRHITLHVAERGVIGTKCAIEKLSNDVEEENPGGIDLSDFFHTAMYAVVAPRERNSIQQKTIQAEKRTSNTKNYSEKNVSKGSGKKQKNHTGKGIKKGTSKIGKILRAEKYAQIAQVFKVKNAMQAGQKGEVNASVQQSGSAVMRIVMLVMGMLKSIIMALVQPLLPIIVIVLSICIAVVSIVTFVVSFFEPASRPITEVSSMPYYCQGDYPDYPFNGGTIAQYGCGITSMAMVASFLTGESITPDQVADLANGNALYNTVIDHGALKRLADYYELGTVEQMAGPNMNCCGMQEFNIDYIEEKLSMNCPIISSNTGGYFDPKGVGHYIVYLGLGENGVYVYDPASRDRYESGIREGGYDYETAFGAAKHIWIFPPGSNLVITGATNTEKIFNALVSYGCTEQAAAAACGNFYQEAGTTDNGDINIAAVQSNGEGIGIAQWSYSLKQEFLRFCESKGKDWRNDVGVQIEFLWTSLNNGAQWTWGSIASEYGNVRMNFEEWKQCTDITQATTTFCAMAEGCHYRDSNLSYRIQMAQEVYRTFGNR